MVFINVNALYTSITTYATVYTFCVKEYRMSSVPQHRFTVSRSVITQSLSYPDSHFFSRSIIMIILQFACCNRYFWTRYLRRYDVHFEFVLREKSKMRLWKKNIERKHNVPENQIFDIIFTDDIYYTRTEY